MRTTHFHRVCINVASRCCFCFIFFLLPVCVWLFRIIITSSLNQRYLLNTHIHGGYRIRFPIKMDWTSLRSQPATKRMNTWSLQTLTPKSIRHYMSVWCRFTRRHFHESVNSLPIQTIYESNVSLRSCSSNRIYQTIFVCWRLWFESVVWSKSWEHITVRSMTPVVTMSEANERTWNQTERRCFYQILMTEYLE